MGFRGGLYLGIKFRFMFYGLMLGVVISLFPFQSYSAQGCGSLKSVLKDALGSGYAIVFTAVTDRALPVMLLTDQTGAWIILGIDDEENACIVARGDELSFLIWRGA